MHPKIADYPLKPHTYPSVTSDTGTSPFALPKLNHLWVIHLLLRLQRMRIVVHGALRPAKLLTAPDKQLMMDVKVFEVKAWPNPSTQYFNLNVESSNKDEQVVVKVFDISGRQVYVAKGAANNNFRFGENFISGVYIVEVSQSGQRRQLKMLKQVD